MIKESPQPNLLYIHSDQHSPYVLGAYGDDVVNTPHLDRLAQTGTLFRNVYCASPICVASRAAMLTGLHPHQTQVWSNNHGLDSAIPTLAHSLGATGLRPILSGRMHAIGPDQYHGYVERYVGDHNSNYIGGRESGRGQLGGAAGPHYNSIVKSGIGQSGYELRDEAVTDASLDFLDRHFKIKASNGVRQPFCLSVGYMLPHAPFLARKDDFERYANVVTMPRIREKMEQVKHPFLRWWRKRAEIEKLGDEEILRCRAAYWALVERLDAQIGRILRRIEEAGVLEDTLIIYTSDHGEMAGEHDLFWKHAFYESSVKVPLIISWPKRFSQGIEISEVIGAIDVTATLLDAMKAPPLPYSPGRSFVPFLTGEKPLKDWRNVAFSEYCNDEAFSPEGGCRHRMIRKDDWKLCFYHEQPCQLFNLKEDPDEVDDLSEDPDCAEIRTALIEEVMRDWNPDEIRLQMALKRRRDAVLYDWARNASPSEILRWKMTDEMNYLEKEESSISVSS